MGLLTPSGHSSLSRHHHRTPHHTRYVWPDRGWQLTHAATVAFAPRSHQPVARSADVASCPEPVDDASSVRPLPATASFVDGWPYAMPPSAQQGQCSSALGLSTLTSEKRAHDTREDTVSHGVSHEKTKRAAKRRAKKPKTAMTSTAAPSAVATYRRLDTDTAQSRLPLPDIVKARPTARVTPLPSWATAPWATASVAANASSDGWLPAGLTIAQQISPSSAQRRMAGHGYAVGSLSNDIGVGPVAHASAAAHHGAPAKSGAVAPLRAAAAAQRGAAVHHRMVFDVDDAATTTAASPAVAASQHRPTINACAVGNAVGAGAGAAVQHHASSDDAILALLSLSLGPATASRPPSNALANNVDVNTLCSGLATESQPQSNPLANNVDMYNVAASAMREHAAGGPSDNLLSNKSTVVCVACARGVHRAHTCARSTGPMVNAIGSDSEFVSSDAPTPPGTLPPSPTNTPSMTSEWSNDVSSSVVTDDAPMPAIVRVPHPTPPPEPCTTLVAGSAQLGDLIGAVVRVAWSLGQDLRTAKGQADSELARVICHAESKVAGTITVDGDGGVFILACVLLDTSARRMPDRRTPSAMLIERRLLPSTHGVEWELVHPKLQLDRLSAASSTA
jgi:hypothetical protein